VLCDTQRNPGEAQAMGAVASIVRNPYEDAASVFSFPVSVLSEDDYNIVLSYVNSTKYLATFSVLLYFLQKLTS